MVSRQRLFRFTLLFLLFGLLLAACERPIPGSEDGAEATVTVVGGEATADANVGGGAPSDTETETADAQAPPASEEDGTPRVDEDTAPPEEGEPAGEGEPSETTGEGTAVTGDESSTEDTGAETAAEGTGAETAEDAGNTTEGEATTPTTHTVAAGENLYRIGLQYKISWVTLAEYNNLANPHQIKVGQVLNIPGATTPAEEPEPTPSPSTETTHTVKAGDNLYRIGLAYGISWVQIAEANGLVNPNQITVGQTLKIPVDTPGPTPQFTHQVKAGETLYLISLQYGVSWTAIAAANDLSSPYVIYEGQTLVIPGG